LSILSSSYTSIHGDQRIVLVYTLGFLDRATLLFKFDKHVTRRREFAFATPDEYETNADRFNGGPRNPLETEECHRVKRDETVGDQLRYNDNTQEFGVLGNDNYIRSYYIPDPARHLKATNRVYFQESCLEQRD
jgi:hypothetical protein